MDDDLLLTRWLRPDSGGTCRALVMALLAAPLAAQADPAPTFHRDIAPLIHRHCSGCHRPGESAPFALLDFRDVQKRRRQIMKVVERRLMPPWLPHPDVGSFAGERRLSQAEIDTLARWVEAGAPEGDPADAPEPPTWVEGWQLGEPDLVVTLDEAFDLSEDGTDVFRNFVVPVGLRRTRYVRAIEFRPENPRVVHHAIINVDRSPSCRELDAADPGPGFAGMTMGRSEPPDGHFLGWTPGKLAREVPDGMAWRLHPGDDFVIQLHMTPSGKPEAVRPRIGVYFTDEPPTRQPYTIVLYSEDIDIPAGAADHVVTDRYALPTDVDVIGIYPHAHYLARRMSGRATLPGGEVRELFRIDDWDFNWQDEYRYREPIRLPAGTVLSMEYRFDNTADNVRNPNSPPERVTFGVRSVDEMATWSLQVVPVDPGKRHYLDIERWRHTLAKKPYDWHAHNELGRLQMEWPDPQAARVSFETAARLNPGSADILANLATAWRALGDRQRAAQLYAKAREIDSEHPAALRGEGVLAAMAGDFEVAVTKLTRSLELRPASAETHVDLANVFAFQGLGADARDHYRQALRVRPGIPEAHNNIATSWLAEGQAALAIPEFRKALALRPDYFNAWLNLGRALLGEGDRAEATAALKRALELRPGDPAASALLRQARGRGGR